MIKDLITLLEVTPLSMSASLKDGVITVSIIPLKLDTDIPPVHISGTAEALDEPGALITAVEKIKQGYLKKGIQVDTTDLDAEKEPEPKAKTKASASKKAIVEAKPEKEPEPEEKLLTAEELLTKLPKEYTSGWKTLLNLIKGGSYIAAKGALLKLIPKLKGSELINSVQAVLDEVTEKQQEKEARAAEELLNESGASKPVEKPKPAAKTQPVAKKAEVVEEEDPFAEDSDEEVYDEVPEGELHPIKPNPKARENIDFVPEFADEEEDPFADN